MKNLILPLAALLTVTACNRDVADAEQPTAADTPTATPVEASPSEASSSAATTPVVAMAIPPAIHGRWGLVAADCTSTRGDAKGLLTIDGTTLKFYESVGTLDEIEEAGDTRIRAEFDFTGEGMEWERDEVLDVQDNGQTLIRREYGDGAAPGAFRYSKCA